MPRSLKALQEAQSETKTTITQYYFSQACVICGTVMLNRKGLCEKCTNNKQSSYFVLIHRTRLLEKDLQTAQAICMQCSGCKDEKSIRCQSIDCQVYFERAKLEKVITTISQYLGEES